MASPAEQLASSPPATPPFDIVRAAFVELHVTDLAASEHFYAELLGMIISARTEDAVYLRGWEERQHHSLVLRQSPPPTQRRRRGWGSAPAARTTWTGSRSTRRRAA